jgi:hypothetical protein
MHSAVHSRPALTTTTDRAVTEAERDGCVRSSAAAAAAAAAATAGVIPVAARYQRLVALVQQEQDNTSYSYFMFFFVPDIFPHRFCLSLLYIHARDCSYGVDTTIQRCQ